MSHNNNNRELVLFYIKYKLSQRNDPIHHHHTVEFKAAQNRTEEEGDADDKPEPQVTTTTAAESPSLRVVRKALRDLTNRHDLQSLVASRVTPAMTEAEVHRVFKSTADKIFNTGINWGRVVCLFFFGGALCVECVEKEMSPLVDSITEWMTAYLDQNVQPWIDTRGGWENFAHWHDAEAKFRESQESFNKWLLFRESQESFNKWLLPLAGTAGVLVGMAGVLVWRKRL